MNQFLRGRFAIAAGDAKKRYRKLLPMMTSETLQRGENIIYQDGFFVDGVCCFVNNGICSTLLQRLRGKSISIEIFTF